MDAAQTLAEPVEKTAAETDAAVFEQVAEDMMEQGGGAESYAADVPKIPGQGGSPGGDVLTEPAKEQEPEATEPSELQVPVQPQGSPPTAGAEPQTGVPTGVPYQQAGVSPQMIAMARQAGVDDSTIGQLGNDQMVQAFLMGRAPQTPQGQPLGDPNALGEFKPFEPKPLPDILDDNVMSFGKDLHAGFGHQDQQLRAVHGVVQQMQNTMLQMAQGFQAEQENRSTAWFDQRVQKLAQDNETWGQTFGKGPIEGLAHPNERGSRVVLKQAWDMVRRNGMPEEDAFMFALNGRFAAQIGQQAQTQMAGAAQALAQGAAVPPAGRPPGGLASEAATAHSDAALAKLQREGKL